MVKTNDIYISYRDHVLFPMVDAMFAEFYMTIKTTFNRKEAQDLKAKEAKKAKLDEIKAKKTQDETPDLKSNADIRNIVRSMIKSKDRPADSKSKAKPSLFGKTTGKPGRKGNGGKKNV